MGMEELAMASRRRRVRWVRRRERAEGRGIESRRMMEMRVWEVSCRRDREEVSKGRKESAFERGTHRG